jgi:glycosyltransferase involved in cell wall biosynthesis
MLEIKENKLKICFMMGAHPKIKPGGAEIQLYQIAQLMAKRRYKVYLVTDSSEINRNSTHWGEGRIEYYKIKSKNSFLKYFTVPLLIFRRIDACIYISRGLFFSLATSLYCKLHRRKSVCMVASSADCIPVITSSVFEDLFKKGIESRVISLLNQLGMCIADKVIAQSEHQKHLLNKNFGIRSIVIKNGMPIPCSLPKKEHPPIVLWLASLKRLKRAEIYIELAKQCQDLDCKFILAGRPSDKGYLQELLERMQGLPHIEYIGGVTFEESNELTGYASIFVNTSEYEGFPNIFIQAWMRETPTVSLDVDPDDVIKKNKLGFHSGSFEQMAKDVRFLIENKKVRQEMGRNARKYVLREHDIKKIVPKYIELIEKMVKKE